MTDHIERLTEWDQGTDGRWYVRTTTTRWVDGQLDQEVSPWFPSMAPDLTTAVPDGLGDIEHDDVPAWAMTMDRVMRAFGVAVVVVAVLWIAWNLVGRPGLPA